MRLGNQWRQAFGSGDYRRGEDYYAGGMVYGLTQTPEGWQAKVDGSRTYTTFVPIDGSIHKMSCSCPRFDHGYLCKHLTATCLAIEEGAAEIAVQQSKAVQSIDELVKSVAEGDLRSFLAEALRNDEMLATQFVQRYGDIDVARACKQMAAQIKAAVWDYSDHGFIDWKGALGFEQAYHRIVHTSIDPLVDRGDLPSAVDLSIQALRCLEPIDIDDSDGFFSSAIDDVERMWDAWLGAGDAHLASLLFERITSYLKNSPDDDQEYEIYSYGADMARDFQVERFADLPAFSERFIALADEQLDGARQWYEREHAELELVRQKMGIPNAPVKERTPGMTNRTWDLNREAHTHAFHLRGAEQGITRWTLIRLRAMRAGGAGNDELLAAAGEYVSIEPICQFFVDRAREQGDTQVALRLLEGCKRAAIERGDGNYPLSVSCQLAELYEEHDVEALRAELRYQLDHVGGFGSSVKATELWLRIRSTFDEEAWMVQREEILTSLDNAFVRGDCLAAEGLFERLMDEVERQGLRALGSHEAELVERFPQRVLKLHLDDIEHSHLYPGNNRKAYQGFAWRLRHIKGIPGGEAEVARIVARMRADYSRRPALMDELSRV